MRSYLKRTPEGKYEWNHQSQTVKRLAKKYMFTQKRSTIGELFWVVNGIFKTYGGKIS